jgi:hypothetical protein
LHDFDRIRKQASHNDNGHLYSFEMEEMINYVLQGTAKTVVMTAQSIKQLTL